MTTECVPDLELLSDQNLFKKHRQERRELQAKIQSMKKSIPKGDKKKKKEIMDLVARMESELNAKQNRELVSEKSNETSDQVEEIQSVEEIPSVEDDGGNQEVSTNARVSRAQKRREKKEAEDKERERRIQEQLELNKDGPRIQETNAIKTALKSLGLGLYSIAADGNCLYCAVNHQLETKRKQSHSIQKLRKLTADFMRENKDEFIPFMYSESEEPVSEENFEEYCKEVANTKLWGGQLELRALSQILKCPIKVIQASGPPTLQGENYDDPELVLTYHRHLYRLGEHYNSTIPVEECAEDEDGFKSYID